MITTKNDEQFCLEVSVNCLWVKWEFFYMLLFVSVLTNTAIIIMMSKSKTLCLAML